MEKSIRDQLGQDYQYYVLCLPCTKKLETDGEWMLAMFGPQGITDEDSVLVCVPWEDRADQDTMWKLLERGQSLPFYCDGCQDKLAVAPSSKWFIDRHRAEREF